MPKIQRTSDIVEQHSERAVLYAFGGIALAALSALLVRYSGDGVFVPVAYVFGAMAAGLIGFAGHVILQVRKVAAFSIDCPFCTHRVDLSEAPGSDDIVCQGCNRMIPMKEGAVVRVDQVRCGFCNSLNYYSEKTEVLLCEECNHEIPISREDGAPAKKVARFAVVEDDAQYELVLTGGARDSEDLIATLQHMLALNRNQVKDILENVPVTLLQGITRMKADMLKAQIAGHGGKAEARALSDTANV